MHNREADEAPPPKPDIQSGSGVYQDDETGDRINVVVYKPKDKRVPESLGQWTISWAEAHVILAKDKRLNLTDRCVLELLRGVLDYDNWIKISLSEMSDLIDIHRAHIHKSMQKLIASGYVLTGPPVKSILTYRLSPSIAYKGSLANAAQERRKALKVIKGGKSDTPTVNRDVDADLQVELPF